MYCRVVKFFLFKYLFGGFKFFFDYLVWIYLIFDGINVKRWEIYKFLGEMYNNLDV